MRKSLLITLLVSVCIITPIQVVFSEGEVEKEEIITIDTYEIDLTGDGTKEEIHLNGILLADDTNYYKDIWVDIKNKQTNQKWKVAFGGGYEPKIKFYDLNNDQIIDIFFQSINNLEEEQLTYYMYTFKDKTIKKINPPKQWHVNGHFKNNFIVNLNISFNEEVISVPIIDEQYKYIQQGIYNDNGKLMETKPIIVAPISEMEPFIYNERDSSGLKTTQKIYGVKTHLLGRIETFWHFDNKKWTIVKTKWIAK